MIAQHTQPRTRKELMRLMGKSSKPPKFHNVRTEYGGRWYHSNREAAHAAALDMLKLTGQIIDWKPQARYVLHAVNGEKASTYIADFLVTTVDGEHIQEVKGAWADPKSPAMVLWKLKVKLFSAEYGIPVRVVQ